MYEDNNLEILALYPESSNIEGSMRPKVPRQTFGLHFAIRTHHFWLNLKTIYVPPVPLCTWVFFNGWASNRSSQFCKMKSICMWVVKQRGFSFCNKLWKILFPEYKVPIRGTGLIFPFQQKRCIFSVSEELAPRIFRRNDLCEKYFQKNWRVRNFLIPNSWKYYKFGIQRSKYLFPWKNGCFFTEPDSFFPAGKTLYVFSFRRLGAQNFWK